MLNLFLFVLRCRVQIVSHVEQLFNLLLNFTDDFLSNLACLLLLGLGACRVGEECNQLLLDLVVVLELLALFGLGQIDNGLLELLTVVWDGRQVERQRALFSHSLALVDGLTSRC